MRQWIAVIAVLCAAFSLPAQSALEVEISEGASGALPIAVVPFRTDSAVNGSVDLVSVINADLRGTGLFEPLPPEDMLASPGSAQDVKFSNWRQVEVDNVVVGSVKPDGQGGYRISFEILDVYQGRVLAGYQITAGPDELRDAAHTVANKIYENLTDEDGYFRSRIAYVTAKEEGDRLRYRLVVSDYDGHDPNVLVSSRDPIMSPAWHPAGTKLAYVAFDLERGRSTLRILDLTTGNIREVSARPGINGAPAWSPNGNKLAMTLSYPGNPEIFVYDVNAGNMQQLTHNAAIDTEPTWSPDGAYIAFTSDRGGKPQIYRMSAQGGAAERMTFDGETNQRAAYGPEGETLSMVQGGPNGFRIAVLDLKSNNMRVVSDGPLDESPSFAPNGQAIIFARQDGGGELATVSVDGSVKRRLQQSGEVREPAWGPAPY